MGNGAKSKRRRERKSRTIGRRRKNKIQSDELMTRLELVQTLKTFRVDCRSLAQHNDALERRCARLEDCRQDNEGLAKAAGEVVADNDALRSDLTNAQVLLMSIWEEYDLEHPLLDAFVKNHS